MLKTRLALVLSVMLAAVASPAQALPDTVTILRDSFGVPHVFADDELEGAFASGYAMAEDRLFQMELLRRTGKGRLAELIGDDLALGRSAIEFDIATRRDLYTEAERLDMFAELERTNPAVAASFHAFVDGVNSYIAEALADPIRKLPPEYPALGILPHPWSVTDSIAFGIVGLNLLGGAGGREADNACLLLRLRERLGDAAGDGVFDDLFWIADPDSPPTITDRVAVWPNTIGRFHPAQTAMLHDSQVAEALCNAAAAQRAEAAAVDEVARRVGLSGLFDPSHSNALVVAGAKTTTGNPMLGGGPQIGYSTPGFFSENGLHTPGYDAAGMNVPLGPGSVMGRTSTLAFTLTSGIDDQVDTYVERLNPQNLRQYGEPGRWRTMDCRTETFLVRMSATSTPRHGIDPDDPARSRPPMRPVVQELCRTHHGPVVFTDTKNLVALSHKKAHWMQDLRAAITLLDLGRKTTLAGPGSVEEALEGFPFSLNFNYASTSGDIAYFHRGLTPLRPDHTDPRLPLPGVGFEWRVGSDGKDYVANSDIVATDGRKAATLVNPQNGWFANWNNTPVKGWGGAGEQRELWGPVHRMLGIDAEVRRLVSAGTPIDLNEDGMDPVAIVPCFANDDFRIGSDPLGCVRSVNGIMRKVATSDVHAPLLAPYLAKALDVQGFGAGSAERAVFDAVAGWVAAGAPLLRRASEGTYRFPGIAIYREWRARLQQALLSDELGADNRSTSYPEIIEGNNEDDHGSHVTPDALVHRILSHAPELAGVSSPSTIAPSRDYCDGGAPTTCAELLVTTLSSAIDALTARFGSPDPASWRERVVVSTIPAQGAAPKLTIERMNRGSFGQLHDFGAGAGFRAFSVVPPGQSGMIDLPTLIASNSGGDPEAAVNAGNPHMLDQKRLFTEWRYKRLIHRKNEIPDARVQVVPYVRGVVPQPSITILRDLYRALDDAGIRLPSFTVLGEVSTS